MEESGTWSTDKQCIDQLWSVPVIKASDNQLSIHNFLCQHNGNCKSTLLKGIKWNPCSPPTSEDNTMEGSGHPAQMLVHPQANILQNSFLLGNCPQQFFMSRYVSDLAPLSYDNECIHPAGRNDKGVQQGGHQVLGNCCTTSTHLTPHYTYK